ncbi:glycosyltransferase, partial [Xanthovirga aplysinae]|uniref:glycosyltransferase n=1 Tax=Xanthovirga aplysinae TaxID=2529853 RepID=UPI0012BBC212
HMGGGPLEKKLRNYIKTFKQPNLQAELKGAVPHQEVLNFYREERVDVFMNVSDTEGVPVTIMEAQSYGIPVIATAVGGTSEIVSNENGILLPKACEVYDIINALSKILDNNFYQKREKSRKSWEKKFVAEINYRKLVESILGLGVGSQLT